MAINNNNNNISSIIYKLTGITCSFFILFLSHSLLAAQCGGGNQAVDIGTPGLDTICANGKSTNPILSLLSGFANYLVAIIGAVGVLMIIISGIQMIASAGQPEAIKAAKKRLTTTIISLVVLVSMRVILNLIVIGSPF